MPNVIPFNNSTQVKEIIDGQGTIGTYGDLALALEDNPGWRVIEGGKTITNPAEGSSNVVPISNYIKTTPELEGGVVGASESVEITAAAGGGVTAASSGVFAGWTLGTAVAGILAGTGVGIAAYDLAPEFWTGLSNRLFGTEIAYEDIKDYRITGLIKEEVIGQQSQNTTYLPYETVETILNYCSQYGLFDITTEMELPDYNTGVEYILNQSDISTFLDCYFEFVRIYNVHWSNNPVYASFVSNISVIKRTILNQLSTNDTAIYIVLNPGYGSGGLGGLNIRVAFSSQSSYAAIFSDHGAWTGGGVQYDCYYNPYGHFNTAHGIKASIDSTGNISWESDSVSFGVYVGFRVDDFEWPAGHFYSPRSTSLGCDFEYVRPPYIYTLPDATPFNPTQPFAEQYPDWVNRLINTNGLKLPYDDPELYPIPWLPTVMPDYDPITQPEKYPTPEPSPSPEPAPSPYPAQQPQPWAQTGKMPQTIPQPYPDPNPDPGTQKDPKTGNPDPVDEGQPTKPTPTPTIVFPTVGGEANAIFTVYNPTLGQLNSLAGVLWSSNFLTNLMKIFTNNPMDAIISLHMLYATPTTGTNKNIVLGCYDTEIQALEVTKQYQSIDCGTVRIPEYFGDARDYVNSVVDVYLPFVGMRHLKTQDIIGSYVTIKACVDVFTGTILYTINIRKTSGIDQVMYAFEGNCGVQLPLTGADKSRMFSVLGAAATGAAVGGVAGAVGGAALSAMNGSTQADIQRSGNFGSNAGAMGVKTPYIVVSRNIGYDSNNYNRFHGFPTNITVSLASCSGFTRVLDCHLTGIEGATDTELQEIESLLKEGVII